MFFRRKTPQAPKDAKKAQAPKKAQAQPPAAPKARRTKDAQRQEGPSPQSAAAQLKAKDCHASQVKGHDAKTHEAAGCDLTRELAALNHRIEQLLSALERANRDGRKKETASKEGEEKCTVCLTEAAHVTTLPCRHTVTCRLCFLRILRTLVTSPSPCGGLEVRCAVCRTPVQRAQLHTPPERLPPPRGAPKKRSRYALVA